MRFESLKITIRSILVVGIVGFVLTALTGCGISHGPYRHGYDGQNYYNNTDFYRSGYNYSGNVTTPSKYNPGNRGDVPTIRYDNGRRGFCW
jgi:hypothetical protein